MTLFSNDPFGELESATWTLAALIVALRDVRALAASDVLAASPQRTAVLEAGGFVTRGQDGFSLVGEFPPVPASLELRLSSLRQALAAAAGGSGGGWAAGRGTAGGSSQGRTLLPGRRLRGTALDPALAQAASEGAQFGVHLCPGDLNHRAFGAISDCSRWCCWLTPWPPAGQPGAAALRVRAAGLGRRQPAAALAVMDRIKLLFPGQA
jgi:hypothetical protein